MRVALAFKSGRTKRGESRVMDVALTCYTTRP